MAIPQISLPHGSDGGVFDSQSWKWLTERLAHLPQVRLVFSEELPQFAGEPEFRGTVRP
jgi:hypothetical protein